ncbi:MAG TPA: DUF2905 domain-containing protein [Spirillospora sp.]|nr:DUF2905 domain-containing protein [Spirillospora sp.]
MDIQTIGRILLATGVVIALLGGVLLLAGRFLNLGSLPGDIRIEGENFTCLVPIASMILLSIVLTIILNIIVRLINHP